MKLLFACMAGLGCALFGVRMAAALARREAMLAAWVRVVEGLLGSVSYLDRPLPDLLEGAAGRETQADRLVGEALAHAARKMRAQRSLDLEAALPLPKALADLNEEDRAIVMRLIRETGKAARPQQLRMLEATRDALCLQARQARDQTQRQRRLYLSLGSMGGVALFLCLI
jgi:stage III sporulation protein AB